MEDFSVPLLADRAYHTTLNPNNNNNNNTTMHHHKDHMLAAGSTPSTTAFLYDITSSAAATAAAAGQSLKSQMSMAMKSDYSTFTTCIQQSALLDHRNAAIDANLDAGVSLGALCDLKFPTNGLSAQLMNETTTTTSPLMSGLTKHNPNGCSTTFSNILFNREDALHHSNTGGLGSSANNQPQRLLEQHQQQYLTLKGTNDVHNTADTTPPRHHYVTNTASNTTATNTTTHHLHAPSNDVSMCSTVGGSNASPPDNNNLLNYGLASSITSSSPISSSSVALAHHHRLNSTTTNPTTSESTKNSSSSCSSTILLNENHITTTTIASMINTPTSDSAEAQHTASKNIINPQAATVTAGTCNVQQSTSQQQHSIEEIGGATACTSTSSIAANSNTLNGNTSKPVFLIIKEKSYSNNANSSNIETTPQPPQSQSHSQPQQQMTLQHTERTVAATSNNHQQQQHRLQSHPQMNSNATYEQSQQQQQQHLLNSSSYMSSDSNDSMSSSDDFIEMEANERAGYQDTTSSHSQQSANGGGGGSGSNPNSSNPSAGVSLINGVVTLNSQNSNALSNNGGGGGGSSASSASGTYMSLLPPNVGATSSSSGGHLVSGVTALGAGGTSATASGSTPEVIDFKHLFEELCPVCGDKVSGYHYGLLTCESCKGFFKRTVQNKKVYTCVAERSCHIDKTQRKRCPYCRFQKCLEVGMKLEAVRADRMRGGRNKFGPMYKRDRARKLQVMRQRQIALQALRTSMGTGEMKATPLSPGYQQAYTNMNIKQEIQIPQVSSLTQSPDSSPSPIAIALGQVNASSGVITTPMNGSSSAGGGGGGGGGGTNNSGNNNSSNTNDGINRIGSGSGGGSGNCHETGTGSLQSASDSKLCFDSGTHPSSTADSIEPLRVSPMIREFVQSIDDREWQTQLFALLQKQTYNQVEVDIFELMCKVLDQNLFSQVDWARNTVFFKDLKVDDQMKLLQHSWSDMLVLDHLHQRIHNGLPDETQLNNGQVFNLLSLGLLGVPQLADYFNELQNKLQDLKFDMGDYVCMKFLILLNPDVRGIINKKTVLQGHENVQAALLDYTLTCYPSVTDKFRRLLSILPDIHAMAARGEEHLYSKHCAGSAPTQTLLMEMLHAKRKV